MDRNLIYVGEGEDHKGLYRSCLRVLPEDVRNIVPGNEMKPGENMRARLRIRYRQPLQDATVLMRESGLFVIFDTPQRSITPGQFAAWYAADGSECPELIGSGVIEK